jgi:hypothetical protein
MPATSRLEKAVARSRRTVTVELSKALQEDFESFMECCESLEVKPRINSFLYYVGNYGTYEAENGSNSLQQQEGQR